MNYAKLFSLGSTATCVTGARRTLAVIMMMWGVLTVATEVAGNAFAQQTSHTLFALFAVRFLVGVFHAPIYPLTGSVLERWIHISSWALPDGLASAGSCSDYLLLLAMHNRIRR